MKFWPSSVPRVTEFQSAEGRCSLSAGLKLEAGSGLEEIPSRIARAADYLGLEGDPLACGCVCQLQRVAIKVSTDSELLVSGSYEMTITADEIVVASGDESGWFYALQTLKQLAHGHRREGGVPCGVIRDTPRFAWRGSMIDSARHFQSVEWILKHLDRMAALKLNRFHWHLTDDEAWRPEIAGLPELTEKAAWRGKGAERVGGFYSREEMRRVVEYARDRYITVIPEIEMPGHCNAVLVAFPRLSCGGEALPLADRGWNAFTQLAGRRAFCAANDDVYSLIERVLADLAEVFDPPYLHIGGDETPKEHWEKCPKCAALLKEIGGESSADLRVHFLQRVADYCRDELALPTIAWTDGVSDKLPRDQIVNAWFTGEAAQAARLGFNVINSNHEWTYLDYPDSVRNGQDKPDWMIVLPLEKIYHFDPMPDGLEASHAHRILGSEAALWTEHVPDTDSREQQLMPRLAAFAEVLWSPRVGRSYDDFIVRLNQQEGALTLRSADGRSLVRARVLRPVTVSGSEV